MVTPVANIPNAARNSGAEKSGARALAEGACCEDMALKVSSNKASSLMAYARA